MLNNYPPLYLFIVNSILCMIQLFPISYAYDKVFEERLSAIKFFKMIIFSIIFGVGLIVIYYVFEIGTHAFEAAGNLCTTLLMILFTLLLYTVRKKEALFLWPSLITFNYLCTYLISSIARGLALQFEKKFFIIAIVTIIQLLLVSLLMVLTFKILIKTNYIVYLRKLLDFPRLCIFWLIAYLGLGVYELVFEYGTIKDTILVLMAAIMIFAIMLITRDFLHKEKIKQNEALILQQDHYVKRLENIQQELRIIQHDYKNMISSLYAQASNGDSSSIKSYIETKLMGVDTTVQDSISQMNQVSRIELPELKGLVLTKMIEAEQNGVLLKIEAINTVRDTKMDINDLIRCIGILLDNAIEASQYQDKAEVTLVLLSEPDKFTAAVKNPILRKPDLSKIWQQGYSTKGENRGLGLTSYKKILNKYANTSSETKITNHTFLQVLLISNVKNDRYHTF